MAVTIRQRVPKLDSWRLWLAVGVVAFAGSIAFLTIGLISHYQGEDSGSPPLLSLFRGDRAPEEGPGPIAGTSYPIRPRVVSHRLIIESIGVDAPVVEMGMDSRNVPDIPLDAGDVGWYNFTAKPGQAGNAVLAGHLNWDRSPGVFFDLEDLEAGDIVSLIAEDGSELTYQVSDNFNVDSTDPDSRWVMAPTPAETITLITCGGTWIPDPKDARIGGNYTDRVVVQAQRIATPARIRTHVGF